MRAILLGLALAAQIAATGASVAQTATDIERPAIMTKIEVIVGDTTLPATLDATHAAQDFAAMLPLDLTLSDYHGIEKIADLPREIDTSAAPESYAPEVGDITLYAPWGNLAIFYQPFRDARGLVRLGAFDAPVDALIRDGDITVHIRHAE